MTPFKRFQLSVVLLILSTIESQNFIKLREYASITLQFWGSASLLASSHVSQSTVEGQKLITKLKHTFFYDASTSIFVAKTRRGSRGQVTKQNKVKEQKYTTSEKKSQPEMDS